jgi:hypothetical protein
MTIDDARAAWPSSPAFLDSGLTHQVADAASSDAAHCDHAIIRDDAPRSAATGDALRGASHGDAFKRSLGRGARRRLEFG